MPVVAVELASESVDYDWDEVKETDRFQRVTLFPDQDSAAVRAEDIHRAVASQLDKTAPDAVAIPGWSEPGALAALDWCGRTRTPAVVMSETTAHDFRRSWWKEFPKKQLIGLFDAALVGGQEHKAYLRTLGMPAERIFLGYDVVDNTYFATGAEQVRKEAGAWRNRLGLPEAYFLASSRFIPKKNLPRLIDAFGRYRSKRASGEAWDLVLLGDGPERSVVEQAIGEAGVADAVHLPGFKQYDELPAYYGLAGAFVHASATEQWGLVVNEAMAAGLPVLVSERCGCAPELVHDGENGYTFDPYDVEEMARHMGRMAHGAYDRRTMGRASRRIIDQWTPDRFASGLEQAVQTAIETPTPDASILDRMLIRSLTYR